MSFKHLDKESRIRCLAVKKLIKWSISRERHRDVELIIVGASKFRP